MLLELCIELFFVCVMLGIINWIVKNLLKSSGKIKVFCCLSYIYVYVSGFGKKRWVFYSLICCFWCYISGK